MFLELQCLILESIIEPWVLFNLFSMLALVVPIYNNTKALVSSLMLAIFLQNTANTACRHNFSVIVEVLS